MSHGRHRPQRAEEQVPQIVEVEMQPHLQRIEEAGRIAFWEWRVPEDRIIWTRYTRTLFAVDEAPRAYAEFLELIHPEDRTRIRSEIEASLARGGPFEHAFRIFGRGGEVRWILERGETTLDRVGRPSVMLGVNIDITEQKRVEAELSAQRAALQESEARLLAAQETARVGIYEWDIVHDRVAWDRLMREIWGVGESEPIDFEVFKGGLHPDDWPRVEAALQRALDPSGSGAYEAEYRVINRLDGRQRWMHTSGRVVFEQGRPRRLLGAAYDVSDRRRMEEALRASEGRFRAAFDNAAIGIASVAVDGRWLMVNERMCEILGYSQAELLELSFQSVTHADDVESDVAQANQLLAGEITSYSMEKRYVRKDGKIVWAILAVGGVCDSSGRVDHLIKVVEDITARKQAEDQRELLIDELNHRVRNILTIIRAIAAQTRRHSGSLEAFGAAFEGRVQALATTHSLLSKLGWSRSRLDLVIEQQVLPYAPGEEALHIAGPELLLPPKPVLALSLVFHELASNAAKYGAFSQAGGRIEVSWEMVEGEEGDRMIELRWRESGGPPVEPPSRTGFGSKLMDINIVHEFRGRIDRDYRPSGLICTFRLPLPSVESSPQEAELV